MGNDNGVGSSAAPAPSTDDLLRLVRHLAGEADRKGLIRLVERWAEQGTLPREAALAEARALLDLCLMDRAWVRLKELTERDPDDEQALMLTASLYLERGWPARARKLVERLRARGITSPELDALARQSDAPAKEPPSDAREIERTGAPAAMVALAERFMATGSFLRARGLLERVRRTEPGFPRVDLLLWALAGDFVRRGETLADLVRELSPPEEDENTDWDTSEHTDVGDVNLQGDGPTAEIELDEEAGAAFPSLFRRPARPVVEDSFDEEATMSSVLSHEPGAADTEAITESIIVEAERGGDTQIMAILPGPGRPVLAPVEGPMHSARTGPDPVRSPLDLKAWQRSMGVEASPAPLPRRDDASEDFLEEEDQDLVVMTRRERPAEGPASTGPRRPLEVIEKYPKPSVPTKAVRTPAPAPTPAPPSPPTPPPREPPEAPSGRSAPWLFAAVMAMTAGFLAIVGWAGLRWVGGRVSERVLGEVHTVLLDGDYADLVETEARLADEVDDGAPPRATRLLALAELRAVLWAEYTGDSEQASSALGALVQVDTPSGLEEEVALIRGQLALGRGDLAGAEEASALAGTETPSGQALALALALDRGDASVAGALAPLLAQGSSGVRAQLLAEAGLALAGQEDASEALRASLLERLPSDPRVFLARHEQTWEALPRAERLAEVDAFLAGYAEILAPRQRARAEVLRADLLSGQRRDSEAREAVESALRVDAGFPAARYRRAAWALADGSPELAREELRLCLEARANDWDCRRGLVQLLVDQNHLEEAAQAADGLGAHGQILAAWVALARGEPDQALQAAPDTVDPADSPRRAALGWYVRGLALERRASPEASALLSRSSALLLTSSDPFDRMLAARAFAMGTVRTVPGG